MSRVRPLAAIFPWRSLLLLGAVLALLLPLGAGAHSDYGQGHGNAGPFFNRHDAGVAGQVAGGIAADGWTRPCPGGPGNACCCGNSFACSGHGKTAVIDAGGWSVSAAPFVALVARLLLHQAPPSPASLPPVPPRGPPLLS
jgi:hypothetical protein